MVYRPHCSLLKPGGGGDRSPTVILKKTTFFEKVSQSPTYHPAGGPSFWLLGQNDSKSMDLSQLTPMD